jgi:hypothetical protein
VRLEAEKLTICCPERNTLGFITTTVNAGVAGLEDSELVVKTD